ncbi:carboxypeptidase-like regulatory domain-containing protein [Flavobacterium sp.]|uniref:carboxypeptidase-like regulatory domain-containing protein n=1 Tax=Flavobacterium sp. TaxID=239 RepID=UPI00261F5C20|nr:carboxypeptidase-like regulatory domain-containing protein [Flavobacterium sp.]
MKKIVLFAMMFSLVVSCSGDDDNNDVVCTEEARAGLNVTVKDAETSALLGEGITVVAKDGLYTETLQFLDAPAQFVGAWERAGTYTLTVTAEGYETFTSQPIAVGEDECHVISEIITVQLQPAD